MKLTIEQYEEIGKRVAELLDVKVSMSGANIEIAHLKDQNYCTYAIGCTVESIMKDVLFREI